MFGRQSELNHVSKLRQACVSPSGLLNGRGRGRGRDLVKQGLVMRMMDDGGQSSTKEKGRDILRNLMDRNQMAYGLCIQERIIFVFHKIETVFIPVGRLETLPVVSAC